MRRDVKERFECISKETIFEYAGMVKQLMNIKTMENNKNKKIGDLIENKNIIVPFFYAPIKLFIFFTVF